MLRARSYGLTAPPARYVCDRIKDTLCATGGAPAVTVETDGGDEKSASMGVGVLTVVYGNGGGLSPPVVLVSNSELRCTSSVTVLPSSATIGVEAVVGEVDAAAPSCSTIRRGAGELSRETNRSSFILASLLATRFSRCTGDLSLTAPVLGELGGLPGLYLTDKTFARSSSSIFLTSCTASTAISALCSAIAAASLAAATTVSATTVSATA